MTNNQIQAITAAVIAALGTAKPRKNYGTVKPRTAYRNPRVSAAVTDPKLDRALKRRSQVAAGFKRRGIIVTFVNETGRFDNVKPYKTWLAEGRVVSKGQHGIKGLFHISQTEVYNGPTVSDLAAVVAQHQAQASA